MTERIYGDQNFRFSETSEAVFVTSIGSDNTNEVSSTNPFPVTGPLTNTQLRATSISTAFDAAFTSPFGDLIAQSLTPLIQMDFVYGINTQTASTTIANTGVADTNASRLRLQTGTNSAGSAIFQSRRPAKYRAGQGVIARFTTAYTTGVASSTQIHGVGNATDGYFFGYNGAAFGILHRNSGSDTWIPQSSWNGDKCDGTGASGFIWDKTKGNVQMIKYPYLGYGNITFWVEDSLTSQMILCHTIRYTNSSASVQISNPNLSSYAQVINSGNTSNVILYAGSIGIFLCGERSFVGNPQWATDNNKTPAATTETCIINLRNATTYNGVTNRSLIRLNAVSFTAASSGKTAAACFLRFRLGATIGGSPSYTPRSGSTANNGVTITSGNSVASFDTAGTTASGGTYQFNLASPDSGSALIDLTPFNLFIAPGEIMTVSAFNTAASQLVGVALNWTEDI